MGKNKYWHWGYYLLAVLGPALILLLRLGIASWTPLAYAPFLPYLGAIVVCAWLGGLGPGLTATACSCILIYFFQIHPFRSFLLANAYEPMALLAFILMGMVISLLGHLRLQGFNAVKKSEERLAEAQRIARMGHWEYDTQSGQAFWSAQVYAIFGVRPETFTPSFEAFLSLVTPEDRERLRLKAEEALATKRPCQIEHGALRPDGCRIDLWEYINVRLDEQGNAICLWGTVQDVTERKRAEAALRASEERFQWVMAATREGVWDWNVRTGEVYYSPAYFTMLGYEPGTQPPNLQAWVDLVHPDDREQTLRGNQECIEGRVETFELEFRMQARSGEWRWILGRGKAVARGPDGRALRMVGTHLDVTERKRYEEALRQSEEKYRQVSEVLPLALWTARPDGVNDFCNQFWLDYSGLTLDESISGGWARCVHPDDLEQTRAVQQEGYRTGRPFTVEYRARRAADGQYRWFYIQIKPVFNEAGQLIKWIGTATDVHDRKLAEEAARQERDFTAAVLDTAGSLIIVIDREGRLVRFNRACEELTGYTAQEVLGKPFFMFLVQEEQEPVRRRFEEMKKGCYRAANENYWRTRGGERRLIAWSNSSLLNARGESEFIIASGIDITDQRRAESELRESEERLRLAAEATGFGMYDVDLLTGKRYWSPEFQAIMGVPPGVPPLLDAQGLPLFVHPDDQERVLPEMRATLDPQGSGEYADEHRVVRADGAVRWVMVRGRTLFAGQGHRRHPVRLSGAVLDITDRKQAEEALRQAKVRLEEADKRKDEFLAMLAHELRNPLAPIRNAIQVLRLAGTHESIRERQQQMIDRQVTHMARLLDDLLDVSRITRGKIHLQKRRVHVGEVMAQAVETAAPLIESRRQQLSLQSPPGDLCVEADWDRLVQILGNLLTNAAKYTDEGGQIRLSAALEGSEAVIRVHDNGIGIAPELLPRIFDLFTQADQSLDRSRGGLGIGLTMVQQLTRMHGGRVEARSDGLGNGSEFIVRLPALAGLPREEAADGERPGEQARGGSFRILVVDDVVDSARSLADLLELWQQNVRVAHDGPSALQLAREFEPEVVLLDIGLPGMDGYEVARRLRWESDDRKMLLIAMTGYGQEEDRQIARESGFDRHMVKPVDLTALHDVLMRNAA